MKIALGSAFRNSKSRLARYFEQVQALQDALLARGDSLHLGLVEGDSTDRTLTLLQQKLVSFTGTIIDRSHGGPVYGSTEHPDRFRALQGVGNGILESCPLDADVLVYVESDLLWDAATIIQCIDRLKVGVDVIAPMIFAGTTFYDVFAFRGLDGSRFAPFAPYHMSVAEAGAVTSSISPSGLSVPGGLVEVSSAGSCLVMRAEVAWQCRVPPEDGLVGFCRDARTKGFKIWADFDGIVRHP